MSGVALSALDAIAVDVGPGRFTGIRVGVAAAKGFGYALGIPVVTARSTELLALGASLDSGPVVPVVDMRRGEVAYALPGDSGNPRLGTPELLAEVLVATDLDGALLVGDGAIRYGPAISAAASVALRLGGDEHAAPRAEVLGRLGAARAEAGDVVHPLALAALYLRGVDVRIGWETRAPVSLQSGGATDGAALVEDHVALTENEAR